MTYKECKHKTKTTVGEVTWCMTCGSVKVSGSNWTAPQAKHGQMPKYFCGKDFKTIIEVDA